MSDTLSAIITTAKHTRAQPALYVGLAGDAPQTPPARIGLGGIERVDIGRSDKHSAIRIRRTVDGSALVLSLADARLSSEHARLTRSDSSWVIEDLHSKNGTTIAGQAITRHPLTDADAILVGHTMLMFRDHGGEDGDIDGVPQAAAGLSTLSPMLSRRFAELASAAHSTVPIEITGESGTGKELAARAVHTLSGRVGRFAAVNCGALPGSLLEAELFGHKKGAYTGAAEDRAGLVRSADGGTLFLDEVAELPAPSQASLLRVLQEGEVVPIGSDRPVKVDLRIVTATHKALDAEVAANRFRADLRARLLGVQVELPPLRDRPEDLGMLISTLLARVAPDRSVAFSADAVSALYAYAWPLNIRELERALAAALAVTRDRIDLQHLPAALRSPPEPASVDASTADDLTIRDSLVAAIARHEGNLAAVSRELGKDRTQIRRWMKRFGLSRGD